MPKFARSQSSQRDSPQKDDCLFFDERGSWKSFSTFEWDATDGHLHKCLWLRPTCLESMFVGQGLHILMEDMGSLSVYLRTLLPQTPSLMFCSMFNIKMFALLRGKRGGPYPFRITLFCFWKSQFQSTFSSLFVTPSGLMWLLACCSGIYQAIAKIRKLMMFQNHLMGYPDGMPGGPGHEQK